MRGVAAKCNDEGMTFEEWLDAAGFGSDADVDQDIWYQIVNGWIDCEDPSEYRSNA